MDPRQFQRVRWYIRTANLLLIAGLIILIVRNCHPMPWWLITLLSVIGLMILLTGRAWCAYACPVGYTLDLLTALFQRLKVRQMKRTEKFNRAIRIFKYFFFVFYFVLHFWIGFDPGWILVFLLVVTSPFIVRFWCSFCPCGLFFGWLNRISPLKLEKDSSKCLYCGSCSRQCPMQSNRISIQKTDGGVFSAECMMCGECIGKCPADGAIRLTLFGKTITESKRLKKSEKISRS